MESLYFLVPCALIFIGLAIKVMFWAIHNGQYDNLDTEAHRILFDADNKPQHQPPQDQIAKAKEQIDLPPDAADSTADKNTQI